MGGRSFQESYRSIHMWRLQIGFRQFRDYHFPVGGFRWVDSCRNFKMDIHFYNGTSSQNKSALIRPEGKELIIISTP